LGKSVIAEHIQPIVMAARRGHDEIWFGFSC
jgi:hypothetical protein